MEGVRVQKNLIRLTLYSWQTYCIYYLIQFFYYFIHYQFSHAIILSGIS